MKNVKVHNLIIVDASGSMQDIYNEALAGINETIKTIKSVQKEDKTIEQSITLLSFADGGEALQYVYINKAAKEARYITREDYQLRGCTALYDAIGESVSSLRVHVKKEDKVLVTIITDGLENNSCVWNSYKIKKLLNELRQQGWVFTYIGANQDVNIEADKIGINNSLHFEVTVSGTIKMFEKEGRSRQRWNERVRCQENDIDLDYFKEEEIKKYPADRITPERIDRLAPNEIFVFGSNYQGKHDGGAAKAALMKFGAIYGEGIGPQGQSLAIPTTGCSPDRTREIVNQFIHYAVNNPQNKFLVTAIGCGHGGWSVHDMAMNFRNAVNIGNICLPEIFWKELV